MPMKTAEVRELTCDNPNCGRTQYEGPANTVPGFILDASEYGDDGRIVSTGALWACRARCVGPVIKHAISEAWRNLDEH